MYFTWSIVYTLVYTFCSPLKERLSGHNAHSFVWLIDEDVLVWFRNGTREEIWGVCRSLTCWRGRFDPETGEASVAAPENWIGPPPQSVIEKVVAAFHPTTIWLFPWPPGTPPQLLPRETPPSAAS
jgi:hypothetical protein